MFEAITQSLQRAFRTIAGKSRLTDENVAAAAEEVRLALLEADVNLNVARNFVERVKAQARGARVIEQVEPGQQFIKVVYDNLVALLGGERQPIRWNAGGLTAIMLCGLQGCGKTTTIAKLAARFRNERRHPMLVAADVQRPAAVEQLRILAEQVGVPVYAQPGGEPVAICRQAMEVGRLQGVDTLLIDTAGRLHIDEELMVELESIVRAVNPHEVLFVCDAMIGQSAVETAMAFKARLPLSGAILTKLDSDARGGAALSLREVAGVAIKFAAAGEKIDALEEFHPERMASRILGMGDIVSLVEKAQQVVDQREAAAMQQRLIENRFTFTDFLKQLGYVRRLGGFKDFLGMLPGLGQIMPEHEIPEREFKRFEAIIQSMTPAERESPEIIDYSRRRRIARGSGSTINDVNDLLKQFGDMKRMVDKMGRAGLLRGGLEALSRLTTGQAPGIGPGGGRSIFGSKKAGTKAQRKKEKRKRRR